MGDRLNACMGSLKKESPMTVVIGGQWGGTSLSRVGASVLCFTEPVLLDERFNLSRPSIMQLLLSLMIDNFYCPNS